MEDTSSARATAMRPLNSALSASSSTSSEGITPWQWKLRQPSRHVVESTAIYMHTMKCCCCAGSCKETEGALLASSMPASLLPSYLWAKDGGPGSPESHGPSSFLQPAHSCSYHVLLRCCRGVLLHGGPCGPSAAAHGRCCAAAGAGLVCAQPLQHALLPGQSHPHCCCCCCR